jgi:hypothetical protein
MADENPIETDMEWIDETCNKTHPGVNEKITEKLPRRFFGGKLRYFLGDPTVL